MQKFFDLVFYKITGIDIDYVRRTTNQQKYSRQWSIDNPPSGYGYTGEADSFGFPKLSRFDPEAEHIVQ